ncbi:MAG: CHAD domain-containing protein [Myxococcota bacterium]|nr:CHAD domain-containing protein [Myxococcota bacterium]
MNQGFARPADIVVRRQLLRLLDQAEAASVHLDNPDSLHEFCSALRRTLILLNAWKDVVGACVAEHHQLALKNILQEVESGRDVATMYAWLVSETGAFDHAQVEGFNWLTTNLSQHIERANARLRTQTRDQYQALCKAIEPHLRVISIDVRARTSRPDYGQAVAMKVRACGEAFMRRLAPVANFVEQETHLHEALNDCLRLGDLLEPLAPQMHRVRNEVEVLAELQTILRRLHDASVVRLELSKCQTELEGDTDAERVQFGIARAQALNDARAIALVNNMAARWLGPHARVLQQGLNGLAKEIEGEAPDLEIERKYLLSAVPPRTRSAPKKNLRQGYLPGKKLIERVRAIEFGREKTFVRTVKLGSGAQRIEVEEPTTPTIFNALWALTEGCRVEKVRYLIPDGDLTWEVDVFSDRDLVLAEIELPNANQTVEFPHWLANYVVREVTDDGTFTNRALAR